MNDLSDEEAFIVCHIFKKCFIELMSSHEEYSTSDHALNRDGQKCSKHVGITEMWKLYIPNYNSELCTMYRKSRPCATLRSKL